MAFDTYTWPGNLPPSSQTLTLVSRARMTQSPYSGAVQTAARAADSWRMTMTFERLAANANGREILGLLARLHGAEHRSLIRVHNYTRRGAGGGAAVVRGNGVRGYSLPIREADADVIGYLLPGDLVSFNMGGGGVRQLCMVTDQVDTDSNGEADIPINPPIRVDSNDGAAVSTGNPTGNFILATPISWLERTVFADAALGNAIEALTLEFIESTHA